MKAPCPSPMICVTRRSHEPSLSLSFLTSKVKVVFVLDLTEGGEDCMKLSVTKVSEPSV